MNDDRPTPTQRLFEDEPYRREAEATVVAITANGVVLDRTIFYAESGGQPGDQGTLRLADGRGLRVTDTRYLPGKMRIVHHLDDPEAAPAAGQPGSMAIDWELRHRHMRMHTCLHVLCGLVDAPVTGCSIHADRGRVDFDLPESLFSREELDARLQAEIERDHPVAHRWVSGDDTADALAGVRTVKAAATGGDRVRVIDIAALDSQPCGGTHVRSLGELRGLQIGRIQKKSRHNRRITVVEDGGV